MSARTIRSATAADTAVILSMIRGLAEFERLQHLCVATEQALERALFGPRPYAEVLILDEQQQAAGFALFFHNFSTFLGLPGLYLEDLFIRPEFRRRGHGEALLRRLAQIATERGCGRFEWSVLDWNRDAIAFYESLGASILPDWRIARVTGEALEALGGGSMTENGIQ